MGRPPHPSIVLESLASVGVMSCVIPCPPLDPGMWCPGSIPALLLQGRGWMDRAGGAWDPISILANYWRTWDGWTHPSTPPGK